MPANGLLVRLPTGRPLGVVLVGGRDTLGDKLILDGGRRRCACAIDLLGCHGQSKGVVDGLDDAKRVLCWQKRHIVCAERDIGMTEELYVHASRFS